MDEHTLAPVSRRGPRDWAVDTCLFLLAVAMGIVLSGMRLQTYPRPPVWLFNVDQAVAALGCAALWLRRRRPVGLALALIALSTFSELVAGALLVSLFTVSVHRPPRIAVGVFGASLLASLVYVALRPEPDLPASVALLLGVAIQGAAVGWGLFVHHRRRLVVALHERTARVESEARLRAEQAHHEAREAIAREIHDVLGHRLSLLSVHAGALEYHPDAPAEDVARAAKVIRESAHQALQDLREVIGVLRAPVGELPQPTFADIRQLVAESSRAGMRVELLEECAGAVPDGPGRTVYRVVQEALTNARKHAPGAGVRIRVEGTPGEGLTVEVGNGAADTARDGDGRAARDGDGRGEGEDGRGERETADGEMSGPPGDAVRSVAGGAAPVPRTRSGRGLVGLTERVALAGGRLEYGPTATDGWRLAVWLPWPP
ncbi:histidine kinase [Streptosporangium sp. NPDC051022]|uniref:sensor histidine kinase n=1 Tax=Streptosporangium sp. NPDC051022 TaxID=3155752 RepID=UPI00344608DD